MLKLVEKLKEISISHGAIGIKQSFEDEGAKLTDIISVRRITDLANLLTFIKIGGCEAKSDINNCIQFYVDGVIVPMIESKFALSKFLDSTDKLDISKYALIESKTGYKNIDYILSSAQGRLSGVIVGRSDLSKSYGLTKNDVDSDFIYEKVSNILKSCKKYGLTTTVGGSISVKSSSFIQKLYYDEILDRIETRNIVIALNDDNIKNLNALISDCLSFEISLIEHKRDQIAQDINRYNARISEMSNRFCE